MRVSRLLDSKKKRGNEKTTVVAVVSNKHLDLFVQTEYINIKKGNLAAPKGDQAPFNTPEAHDGTVPNNSIPQAEQKVNTSSEKTSKNIVENLPMGSQTEAHGQRDQGGKRGKRHFGGRRFVLRSRFGAYRLGYHL